MRSFGTTLITCHYCGTESWKSRKEIDRQRRRGRDRFFCGSSCAAKQRNKDALTGTYQKHLRVHNERVRLYQHGPTFRRMLRRARIKDCQCDLTTAYLEELWKKQDGRCAITNVPLVLYGRDGRAVGGIFSAASLDRIDSGLGYRRDNVHFVVLGINYAKNSATVDDVKKLLDLVIEHYQPSLN